MVTRLVQSTQYVRKVGVVPKVNSGSRADRPRWANRRRFNIRKRNGGYEFQLFMLLMLL
jgi:hypothetical protein